MTRSKRSLLACLLSVLCSWLVPTPSRAQGVTTVLTPNQSYTVFWDLQPSDVARTPKFRLWIDGQIARNWTSGDVTKNTATNTDGTTTFSAAGVPIATAGVHQIAVSMVESCLQPDGSSKDCELQSDPVGVQTGFTGPGAKPTHVIIKITVTVQPGGNVSPPQVTVTTDPKGGGGH